MAAPQPKYRPSFTLAEIQYLITILDNHALKLAPTANVNAEILTKLRLLTYKVDLGAVQPAFTTSPRESIEARLGIESVQLTPAQKREAAYIKYQGTPLLCSDTEVMLAKTYMYDNNMLTEKEREDYESIYLSES